MKKILNLLQLTVCLLVSASACAETYNKTFYPEKRYSKLVIESRLGDFYANTKQKGLNVYDADGKKTASSAGSLIFDYVPGLVAKAVIEAADYYKKEPWAKSYYYSIENYANACFSSIPTTGGSLDDLNATKMYFALYELARNEFKGISAAETAANAEIAMEKATEGLKAHNNKYAISSNILKEAEGGWWHKKSYDNQMWLDGQYMGPALLAQLINYGYGISNSKEEDWELIAKQFSITWNILWDKEKKLLFHAFAALPTASTAACWADKNTLHNQEYWGRAEGWYFLALVDVLEEMQKAGLNGSERYNTLKGYLNEIADGLTMYQDKETGCWFQLLAHDGSFYADRYQGKSYSKTYNYIESSATAIFIASYLKGMRLGLMDKDYTEVAKKAYKGFVENFIVDDGSGKGTVHLINCCRSAGLGGSANRDGSAAYYLLGSDVTRTTAAMGQTEGKVLGAFILAATEYERAFIDKESATVLHNVKHDTDNACDFAYNITGQRIDPDSHGLMVKNGKAYIK